MAALPEAGREAASERFERRALNIIIIILIIVFVVGIVVLNLKSPQSSRGREEFLNSLTRFIDGRLDSIPDIEGCYRVSYRLEGCEFIFEDLMRSGFKDKVNIGILKVQTKKNFTLTFSEHKKSGSVRSDLFMASNVPNMDVEKVEELQKPKQLKDFDILTNNVGLANHILQDAKLLKAIVSFRNKDNRGYYFMTFRIMDGWVMLDFMPQAQFNPSLATLHKSESQIENYSMRLLDIVRKIDAYQTKQSS